VRVRSVPHAVGLSAIGLLVAANLIWAAQGVAVKLLDLRLGPLAIALLPLYGITVLGLWTLLMRGHFAARLAVAWRCRGEFLLIGIGGQLLAQVGYDGGGQLVLCR
jgi:hypothetical protein